mgnify:CR=1 FL=1
MIGIFYKSSLVAEEAGGGRGEEGVPFDSFFSLDMLQILKLNRV